MSCLKQTIFSDDSYLNINGSERRVRLETIRVRNLGELQLIIMWLSWISHGYHVTDMYSESGELEQLELVESSENSSLRSFEVCMCEGCIVT